MVFAGAGAGNSNSTSSFFSMLWPIALFYVAYLAATIFYFWRSRYQAAQYIAWSPLLLVACVPVLGMLLALVGV
jgi:hypothetical protein